MMCTTFMPSACGGQKRSLGSRELELEMLVWVLGVEPKSSAGAASAFKLASPWLL